VCVFVWKNVKRSSFLVALTKVYIAMLFLL
jgi:hypothetical protein